MHLHFFYDRSGALGQLSHDGLRPCVHCTGLTRGRVAMPIEQHTNGLIPATLISVLHVPMCGECFIAPRGADVEHVDVGEPLTQNPCVWCAHSAATFGVRRMTGKHEGKFAVVRQRDGAVWDAPFNGLINAYECAQARNVTRDDPECKNTAWHLAQDLECWGPLAPL